MAQVGEMDSVHSDDTETRLALQRPQYHDLNLPHDDLQSFKLQTYQAWKEEKYNCECSGNRKIFRLQSETTLPIDSS